MNRLAVCLLILASTIGVNACIATMEHKVVKDCNDSFKVLDKKAKMT